MSPAPVGNRNRAALDEDREVVVRFRCTERERETINGAARQRGVTVSEMLREMLREKKILPRVD